MHCPIDLFIPLRGTLYVLVRLPILRILSGHSTSNSDNWSHEAIKSLQRDPAILLPYCTYETMLRNTVRRIENLAADTLL